MTVIMIDVIVVVIDVNIRGFIIFKLNYIFFFFYYVI